MVELSDEIMGYAVALFFCYGVFVGVGLGLAAGSLMFLLLGVATALAVMVIDLPLGASLPSVVGAVLFCTGGFVTGWGGFHLLLWMGLPAALFGNGVR